MTEMSRTVVSVSPEELAAIRTRANPQVGERAGTWQEMSADVLLLLDALESFREQHTRIWTTAHDRGLSVPEPGWRDAEYREWDIRLEQTVECPDCGFSFGRGHTDETDGYVCPACEEIALRSEVERLRALLGMGMK